MSFCPNLSEDPCFRSLNKIIEMISEHNQHNEIKSVFINWMSSQGATKTNKTESWLKCHQHFLCNNEAKASFVTLI